MTNTITIIDLVNKLLQAVVNPIIGLLFAIATAVFIWGIVQYVIGSQGEQSKLASGKKVITYGLIGMFIMASAWGIVNLFCEFIQKSFNLCTPIF